jgi:hypothetical protein
MQWALLAQSTLLGTLHLTTSGHFRHGMVGLHCAGIITSVAHLTGALAEQFEENTVSLSIQPAL